MPRPRKDYSSLQGRPSADEIRVIKRAKIKLQLPSLSAVVEHALRAWLDATNGGRKGLHIQPVDESILKRRYLIASDLKKRIDALTKHPGYNQQQILRAALARLAQEIES